MAMPSFNTTIAARTRCAQQVLTTPDLLQLFEAQGGVAQDLVDIVESGNRAETFNLAQSQANAGAVAASAEALEQYKRLQREYAMVMGILSAVRRDLEKAGADETTLAQVGRVMANETQLHLTTVEVSGEKKRKAQSSRSHEAVRIEIEKDACGLLALTAAHGHLARRKVDVPRLEALRDAARALSGKLAQRAAQRGAKKAATREEREAVAEQTAAWTATYRILAQVGARESRVRSLLGEAARR